MIIWDVLDFIVDWIWNWETNLRSLGALVLALIVAALIPFDSLRLAGGIVAYLFAMIVEIRWDPLRVTLPMPKWIVTLVGALFGKKKSVAPSPAFRSNAQRKVSDSFPA